MKYTNKTIILTFLALFFAYTHVGFALVSRSVCSVSGYTVSSVNGVFIDEDDAVNNERLLAAKLGSNYKGEAIDYRYFLNNTHGAGVLDLLSVAVQKIFDTAVVDDYDLREIIKSASEKVATQKLLLVAHSQGNFYANSFYAEVAGKEGGVPTESIGVYSVATPSGRVAGGGKWLTSDTDKVITGAISRVPFRKILAPNTHIVLQDGDDKNGHSFSGVYLKYNGDRIVSDIESSLNNLKNNNVQDPMRPCIDPPKLSLFHKTEGLALKVVDPVSNLARDTIFFSVGVVYQGSVVVVNIGVRAVGVVWSLGNFVADSVFSTSALVYDVGEKAVIASAGFLADVTNTAYSAIKSFLEGSSGLANNNSAAVVLSGSTNEKNSSPAVTPEPIKLVVVSDVVNKAEPIVVPVADSDEGRGDNLGAAASAAPVSPSTQNQPPTDSKPKIIFIGAMSPGFGGGAPIQKELVVELPKTPIIEEKVSGSSLDSPKLSVPQCDFSLANDGCLLATTTILFAWSPVTGAEFYEVSKNGEFATTTETSLSLSAKDFSDYNFSVKAVSSATSSTLVSSKVSVASIPIAINEIAWMGTLASSNDEWLELKNNTSHEIDLTDWALASADNTPYVILSGVLYPNEYRVLQRREGAVTTDTIIDTYGTGAAKWALGNNGENLKLSHASTTLDLTPNVAEGWAGGYNSTTTRKTMERYSSTDSGANRNNWGTNIGYIVNGLDRTGSSTGGTPGAKNSVSYLINRGKEIDGNLTLTALDGFYISTSTIVNASSTLTIGPGVVIKFIKPDIGSAGLTVFGELRVLGTSEDSVIFQSFSDKQVGSISFIGGLGIVNTIDFAHIENTEGVFLNQDAFLSISNTNFIGNRVGLDIGVNSHVTANNINIASTTYYGIDAYLNSELFLASSTIDGVLKSDAINVSSTSRLWLSSTTIDHVYGGDGIEIYAAYASVSSSTIQNIYNGDGIGVYGDGYLTLSSTTIQNVYDGDGIGVYDSTINVSSSTIENIQKGDGVGLYLSGMPFEPATSTISNTVIKNGSNDGISVYGEKLKISGGEVSGFDTGVYVSDAPEPVIISGTNIHDNDVGVSANASELVVIEPSASVHDNNTDLDLGP